MSKWRCFEFRPLDIYWNGDGMWFVLLMHFRFRDWEGQLFGIEYDMGCWRFEFMYLRDLVFMIRNWWNG